MGPQTKGVPLSLFHDNRARLVKKLQEKNKDSVVLLQGGSEISFYDTDTSYVFRQVKCYKNALFYMNLLYIK